MIFNAFLTKYLLAKGVSNRNIYIINITILAILYSILYRFFYLHFEYTGIRIAITIVFVSFFIFTLIRVKKIVNKKNNI
jgi:hypothetical protein